MMNLSQKRGTVLDHVVGERVVLVAVKASREISRSALVWALTHVVQPGDCAKLLVVIPAHPSANKRWGFSKLNGDCASSQWKSLPGNIRDQKEDITESCSQLMLKLRDIYDTNKVKMKVKVIIGTTCGVVAAEAKRKQTQWVVLDKKLRKEAKICMERLECNVVVMKRSRPKVLRLNLIGSPTQESEPSADRCNDDDTKWESTKAPNVTPASSPEHSSFTTTENGNSSLSSLDLSLSPFVATDHDWDPKKDPGSGFLDGSDSETDSDDPISSPSSTGLCSSGEFSNSGDFSSLRIGDGKASIRPINDALRLKFSRLDRGHETLTKNVRKAVSLTRNTPPKPPPLCSICRHKAPVFGNPPRWFGFRELEDATDAFSEANFLAEGGFGSVHRGVLRDGRMVAVKQHKPASSQGDDEFCSEVEVLSCAQHRNVVTLVGFCVEDTRRLLVYEYVCNGSLDSHLYGHDRGPLEWSARKKIAIGAARGLRYLHEECRVGCIVHRDVRPNNILITHDFEAMVGDFGLARWQPEGDMGEETRIIGTFGYLAPEYAQSGEITEKADMYSFGVVLVELITGRKAVDMNRPRGQQCLTEWARPLLEENATRELIDPCLGDCYSEPEVRCMSRCASLCIKRDPHLRPRMSQVIWMMENDNVT